MVRWAIGGILGEQGGVFAFGHGNSGGGCLLSEGRLRGGVQVVQTAQTDVLSPWFGTRKLAEVPGRGAVRLVERGQSVCPKKANGFGAVLIPKMGAWI